jgi:hypothetical protein
MKFRKGQTISFKDRDEKIIRASNNRMTGYIQTTANRYSVDFLMRWLDFGFIKIKKENTQ